MYMYISKTELNLRKNTPWVTDFDTLKSRKIPEINADAANNMADEGYMLQASVAV